MAELKKSTYRALVLDMQPIDPPVGGGRIRLLGLYHNLGCRINTIYIGTYDWPGENYRDHYLSETLREINIPLSEQHFRVNDQLKKQSGGVNFIDVLFSRHGHLSQQYILKIKNFIPDSDIVVFSHPWVFPLVRDILDFKRQYIIYDSQNVESYLRHTLLDDGGGLGTDAVREVVKVEYELCHRSHNILVCSHEDGEMFNRFFGIPISKMIVVPNGVFTKKIKPVKDEDSYNRIKKVMGFKKPVIFFMGSNYGPNIEGAHFIIDELAETIPNADFVIAGGVGQSSELISKSKKHDNVIVTGFIEEQEKLNYLHAADIAINPMFRGSGTNIKMFDFMAAGLPVVSTDIGARGIIDKSDNGVILSTKETFHNAIVNLLKKQRECRLSIGLNGRMYVEKKYSWEKITKQLGLCMINQLENFKHWRTDKTTNISIKKRIGIVTTWNIRCGIAAYSKYLTEGFIHNNYDVLIFGNDRLLELSEIDNMDYGFYPAWEYGSKSLNGCVIDVDTITKQIKEWKIEYLFIQHHDAFFPFNFIVELCRQLEKLPVKTAIMFHNNSELDSESLKRIKSYGVNLFIHHKNEKKTFSDGFDFKYIPMGVLNFNGIENEKKNAKKGKYIATFGFLRPHKGILELIQSMPLILNNYPDTRLICVNSLYPSEDSQQYFFKCKKEIERLGLNDYIELHTDFLPIGSVMSILSTTDLIVFPYYPVDDGASLSANIAMSCRKPILISRSEIFDDIGDIFPKIEEITPEAIAKSVYAFFEEGSLERFEKVAIDYAEKRSWNNVARMYIEQST